MSISRDRYKRSAYERGESAVALNVVICNHGNKTLNDLTLRIQPYILGSEPVKIASLVPWQICTLLPVKKKLQLSFR